MREEVKDGPCFDSYKEPWETPCFTFPQFECMLQFELGDSVFVFSQVGMIQITV